MEETLIKYLAGLMDADGSLSFSFKEYEKAEGEFYLSLSLRLSSSDAVDANGFVDSLPTVTKMGNISRYGKSNQFKAWYITKRSDLECILPRIIKHMVVKGKHWQWMLNKWREQRSARISLVERQMLTSSSKMSRIENAGPVKSKNHPTWSWLAGYLDGDGWYSFRYTEKHRCMIIQVGAVAHNNDIAVLKFLNKAFGGVIYNQGQSPYVSVWKRNLGVKDASFAINFLGKLAKHSRLKRHKIEEILSYHRQRLSEPSVNKRKCCIIDGCDLPAYGHNMCKKHYGYWYRRGDPLYVSDSLNT